MKRTRATITPAKLLRYKRLIEATAGMWERRCHYATLREPHKAKIACDAFVRLLSRVSDLEVELLGDRFHEFSALQCEQRAIDQARAERKAKRFARPAA